MSGLRRRPRSVALLRLVYRVGYRTLQAWSALTHPAARGVKVLLRDGEGRVLFVRHAYGDREAWEIPGGGAHRGETAVDAARREAREELGVEGAAWERLAVVEGVWHGRSEHLEVFGAPWPGGPVRRDPVEIAEAAWWPLDAPPDRLGPSTRLTLAALGALVR